MADLTTAWIWTQPVNTDVLTESVFIVYAKWVWLVSTGAQKQKLLHNLGSWISVR